MAFYRRRTRENFIYNEYQKSSAFFPHADESRRNLLEIFLSLDASLLQYMTLNAN